MEETHILKYGETVDIPEWAKKVTIEWEEEIPEIEIKLGEHFVETTGYLGDINGGVWK